MKCQYENCTHQATFHITDLALDQVMHYCEIHARDHLGSHEPQSTQPRLRKIDFATYCSTCGHDDQSYTTTDQAKTFSCPSCSRAILNITGTEHAVIIDTDIHPTIIRECRIVPIAENGGVLTVVSDFNQIELIDKTRFMTNTDFLVVYADPNHIDSLIENHL